MRVKATLLAGAAGSLIAFPAFAQESTDAGADAAQDEAPIGIIVTAQRKAESLQSVPIAVSAFDSAALETQQIENSSDLQLTLPNVTFTKTNFTSSSFTIRGIGDLCVGFSCDSATGIHVNDMPLLASRLFETEYFDLERVEVLRGPQGTLFGRNATSGVVNVITAKPEIGTFAASGDFEYGNYNSMRAKAMVNVPLGDTLAFRAAGYYLNRDGYTTNVLDGSDIDGRDLYAVRGSLRWEPTVDTTLDLIGYYFEEDDDRSRVQKQLCHRDPTGVLGCLPDYLANEHVNTNATLGTIASSREFLGVASGGALAPFGLSSIFGPDAFAGITQPESVREVRIDYAPTYYADEMFVMAKLQHDFGPMVINVTGGYAESSVDSVTDYYLAAANPYASAPGSGLFAFQNSIGLTPVGQAFMDSSGNLCASDPTGGTFAGNGGGFTAACGPASIELDRSYGHSRTYSLEAHLDSDFDGPINFLLGGLYLDNKQTDNGYAVVATGIDYASAVLGYAQSLSLTPTAPGSLYLGAPFFNNNVDRFHLKSYGVFGELYFQASDALKFTAGLRYSNDKKNVQDRNVILNCPVPVGETNIFNSPFCAGYDADVGTAGPQTLRNLDANFDEITGRFVIDYEIAPGNLLYASYSRGYKSGGINPPFNPVLFPDTSATFRPEIVNAFEIGSKNTFGDLQFNLTGFYYDYKDLQLSRILNRTSFNDNTDATIWGFEAEAIARPDPSWMFNANVSYLKSKIKDFELVDTRDPSGGRSDVMIIKDITNASNCVIIPNGALPADALLGAVNGAVGLPTTANPIGGTNTTGQFSICSALANTAAGPFGGAFTVQDGVPVNLKGNQLPQAPNWKFAVGAQKTWEFNNGMDFVLRGDMAYTGGYYSRSFNRNIDRIEGYEVVNVSATLNGVDKRWYVRGFVQNLTSNDAITGQYVTDPATGLFTNVFTLEPRRYGVAVGVNF